MSNFKSIANLFGITSFPINLLTKWTFVCITKIHKAHEACVCYFEKSWAQHFSFLDDMLLVAETESELEAPIEHVVRTLQRLGFVINQKTISDETMQEVNPLGFSN